MPRVREQHSLHEEDFVTPIKSNPVMSGICPAPIASILQYPISPKIHYLLSGTFNTLFLYLLAFNPHSLTLSIQEKIRAEGPHQFLALDGERKRVYATTWAREPSLSAWEVLDGGRAGVRRINTVPITATSSYIQVHPDLPRIYSAGGPTGEIHSIDEETGGFGENLQELLYVQPEELEKADKTRVALRYGSHSFDLSLPRRRAYVAHLGHNSMFMYNIEEDGTCTLIADCPSFGNGHDGPRHVVPSPDGNKIYAVTEHTSFVDVYDVKERTLSHVQRLTVIPPSLDSSRMDYRGDTLRFSQDGQYLYVTTRGKTSATKGFVAVWAVQEDGSLGSPSDEEGGEERKPIDRYETPNSGGKANAIETFPFHPSSSSSSNGRDWIVLTDDEQGWVWILEFDGKRIREVAGVQLGKEEEDEEGVVGASHAVWLS